LTQKTREEYLYLAKKAYISSFLPQYEKIKEGFYSMLHPGILLNLTCESIESGLCGVHDLKAEDIIKLIEFQNEDYNNVEEENPTRKQFLTVMQSLTKKQLSLFMKFISGTSRSREGFNIKIVVIINYSGSNLPTSATCFRTLYLGGSYPSEENLKKKLIYAIENCNEIAETYYTYNLDADFGL